MVRLAVESDIRNSSISYTRAFDDDPVWRWYIPSDGYTNRWMILMDGFLRHSALPYQINHTTDDGVSTAIWTPPVPQEASDAHAEGLALAFQNCFGERLERFQQGFGLMQTKRPHKPHWYLSALATHPGWHGQGLGSTVLPRSSSAAIAKECLLILNQPKRRM